MNKINLGGHIAYEFNNTDLVDEVLDEIKHLTFFNSTPRSNSALLGYNVNQNLFKSYYNCNLYTWIDECLQSVAKIHFKNFSLKVCDLWATKTMFGCSSDFHEHSLSFFSGLYYLDDSNTDTLFQLPDMFYERHINLLGDNNLVKTGHRFSVTPKKGKMIIWPSYIMHSISTHKETSPRYSIAYNTFINGDSVLPASRCKIQISEPYGDEFSHKLKG